MKQMIAWYVNGTLGSADRLRLDTVLRDNAETQAYLTWERAVQIAVRDDQPIAIPFDRGLQRVMARIRAHSRQEKQQSVGWYERFFNMFGMSPALALACGLIVVQFAAITQLWPVSTEESVFSQSRSLQLRSQKQMLFLKVTFRENTKELDLRALVNGLGAEIVAGPSQIGDYYLLVDKEAQQAATAALQLSPLVDTVEWVNELPPRQ